MHDVEQRDLDVGVSTYSPLSGNTGGKAAHFLLRWTAFARAVFIFVASFLGVSSSDIVLLANVKTWPDGVTTTVTEVLVANGNRCCESFHSPTSGIPYAQQSWGDIAFS